jgi:hypothetical protein
LIGDFSAKAGSEDIFKPTIGNESLHEISNDNGVGVVCKRELCNQQMNCIIIVNDHKRNMRRWLTQPDATLVFQACQ